MEGFSKAGVPVFVADVKGDLSGSGETGANKPALVRRAAGTGPLLVVQRTLGLFRR